MQQLLVNFRIDKSTKIDRIHEQIWQLGHLLTTMRIRCHDAGHCSSITQLFCAQLDDCEDTGPNNLLWTRKLRIAANKIRFKLHEGKLTNGYPWPVGTTAVHMHSIMANETRKKTAMNDERNRQRKRSHCLFAQKIWFNKRDRQWLNRNVNDP